MGHMRALGSIAGLAAIAAVLAGCGDGGGGNDGPHVTDPAAVPTATALQNPNLLYTIKGEIVSVSGGPERTVAPGGSPTVAAAGTYTIESGDTCGALASEWGVTVDAIIQANRGKIDQSCTNLFPGDTIKRPTPQPAATPVGGGASRTPTPSGSGSGGGRTYTLQDGDTCSDIATAYGVTVDSIISANGGAINADCTNLHPGDTIKIP